MGKCNATRVIKSDNKSGGGEEGYLNEIIEWDMGDEIFKK